MKKEKISLDGWSVNSKGTVYSHNETKYFITISHNKVYSFILTKEYKTFIVLFDNNRNKISTHESILDAIKNFNMVINNAN